MQTAANQQDCKTRQILEIVKADFWTRDSGQEDYLKDISKDLIDFSDYIWALFGISIAHEDIQAALPAIQKFIRSQEKWSLAEWTKYMGLQEDETYEPNILYITQDLIVYTDHTSRPNE